MTKKKEPEYIEITPTPEAVALIQRALGERKTDIMEGLLSALWQSHAQEVADGHAGDDWCSTCDIMREAARILELDHPSLASDCNVPKADPYANTEDSE
jgi:hypothetical protein